MAQVQGGSLGDQDFEQRVRETAYFQWELDGRPEGAEKGCWFAALEGCLREREADHLRRQHPVSADGETVLGRQANYG
ncbi:DUF2934 domain-containing protein [Devosia sp. XJ19-1]|uniref:DUF2934 domain-containing protein n=1 Tax=Devosia ureilytica TaxID=2952754 RepID=A0A9Q4FUK4_9HYPH|nr:DUF2934 domain-containing protein [Devosia ureilytica]MCP8885201.1 DUF2934 domain-containing protein [Devosia ureilytica]MCP8888923.1 DUF2934 domain-containing protein [Devosia ureilytica]